MEGDSERVDPENLPDDLDDLEAAFAAVSPSAKVSVYLTFDPSSPDAPHLPPFRLRRDAEAYPQIIDGIRREAGTEPGEYKVELRAGGKVIFRRKLHLEFLLNPSADEPGIAPAVPPPGGAPERQGNPDFMHEIGERIVRRAVERQLTPADDDDDDFEELDDDDTPGPVLKIIDRVLENESVQGAIGDWLDGVTTKRRAEAKLIEAQADELKAKTETLRRGRESIAAQLGETATGKPEAVKLRQVK